MRFVSSLSITELQNGIWGFYTQTLIFGLREEAFSDLRKRQMWRRFVWSSKTKILILWNSKSWMETSDKLQKTKLITQPRTKDVKWNWKHKLTGLCRTPSPDSITRKLKEASTNGRKLLHIKSTASISWRPELTTYASKCITSRSHASRTGSARQRTKTLRLRLNTLCIWQLILFNWPNILGRSMRCSSLSNNLITVRTRLHTVPWTIDTKSHCKWSPERTMTAATKVCWELCSLGGQLIPNGRFSSSVQSLKRWVSQCGKMVLQISQRLRVINSEHALRTEALWEWNVCSGKRIAVKRSINGVTIWDNKLLL